MTIQDIQNQTSAKENELAIFVRQEFDNLKNDINATSDTSNISISSTSTKHRSLGIASFAIATCGIIGWVATDSWWSKACVGGGISLLLLDKFINNQSDIRNAKTQIAAGHQYDLTTIKLNVQKRINDVFTSIENFWDEMISINKVNIQSLIDNSEASGDSKFKATNIAALPKHIDFSLLPYINKIVSSKSIEDIIVIINTIEADLQKRIKDTAIAQNKDYAEILHMIG